MPHPENRVLRQSVDIKQVVLCGFEPHASPQSHKGLAAVRSQRKPSRVVRLGNVAAKDSREGPAAGPAIHAMVVLPE